MHIGLYITRTYLSYAAKNSDKTFFRGPDTPTLIFEEETIVNYSKKQCIYELRVYVQDHISQETHPNGVLDGLYASFDISEHVCNKYRYQQIVSRRSQSHHTEAVIPININRL